MKNADLVRRLPRLAALRQDAALTEREARASWAQSEKLREEIRELAQVTEVREGVALKRYQGFIQAVGDDIVRYAQIYPNVQNNGDTWGLRTFEDSSGHGERWWGKDWPDAATAEEAALAWIVRGILPTPTANLPDRS